MGAQAASVRRTRDLRVIADWLASPASVPLVLECHVNPEVRAT